MKIGIDTTSIPPKPGGAANYTINLVRELVRLPCDCSWVIFVQESGKSFLTIPESDHVETVTVETVTVPDHSPAVRLAWEQTVLPILVKRHKIDLLHSPHYTRPTFLGCRSVVTFHDMTFFLFPHLHTRSKRLFFPAAIRLSAKLADGLLAVSENTRQDAIRLLGIPPKKISTTMLGVSNEYRPITDQQVIQQIRSKYQLPDEFILYIGTVEPRKNLPLLLRAYRSIHNSDPNFIPLVVVGQKGWNYDEVFQFVEDNRLSTHIQFPGYVPTEDIPAVYNAAKIFVFPTLYEGFGLPPLEAMACGTPTITSAVSSLPEHVGDAGVLVPPGDEAALSAALLELIEDDGKRQYLSNAGAARARSFTWEKTARATLEVYQHILGTGN